MISLIYSTFSLKLYSCTPTNEVLRNLLIMLARFLLFIAMFVSVEIALSKELVLNSATTYPFSTPEKTGFIDLIVSKAFRRIGIKLNIIHLPAERALRYSNSGKIDGELLRIKGIDKIYPNLIRIPEKIIDWEFIAFSNQKISLTNDWQSLSKYSITFLNGWKIYEINVPKSAAITKVNSPKQLFSLLLKNRAELALYDLWSGLYYIKQHKLKYVHPLLPPLAEKEMFIYLHRKHIKLIPLLENALIQIKKDGTYQKLKDKILSPLKLK